MGGKRVLMSLENVWGREQNMLYSGELEEEPRKVVGETGGVNSFYVWHNKITPHT